MNNEAIVELLEKYDSESRAIKHEALRAAWSMRGGLSYEDAMYLSQGEREIVSDIIKENMDITKESKLPYF
jgi:hypothetical protein